MGEIRVLVDETSDGLDEKIRSAGYDAQSVKKLKDGGDTRMACDFNVIQYARENDMVLITKDREMGKACRLNGIRCILPSDELVFERIIIPDLMKMSAQSAKTPPGRSR